MLRLQIAHFRFVSALAHGQIVALTPLPVLITVLLKPFLAFTSRRDFTARLRRSGFAGWTGRARRARARRGSVGDVSQAAAGRRLVLQVGAHVEASWSVHPRVFVHVASPLTFAVGAQEVWAEHGVEARLLKLWVAELAPVGVALGQWRVALVSGRLRGGSLAFGVLADGEVRGEDLLAVECRLLVVESGVQVDAEVDRLLVLGDAEFRHRAVSGGFVHAAVDGTQTVAAVECEAVPFVNTDHFHGS